MKITLLSANPPEANPYVGLLADAIVVSGAQVTLATGAADQGVPEDALDADVIHLHWLELWRRPDYRSMAGLTRLGAPGRLLRRWLEPQLNSPDAFARRRQVLLNEFLDWLAGYKAGGGHLVYTLHNIVQHEGEATDVELQGLRRLLDLADAIHVHSHAMVIELQDRLGNAELPSLAVIPHGNYIGVYPNLVSRGEAQRRLDLPGEGFNFLFLGLIRPYKGVEELLPAFAGLQEPDARLLIAGQSRPRGYAAGLADSARADDRVLWHPSFVPPDEIQQWMNASDIVVLPYREVTTSGAAMLAFSFARPILAPALPGFVELVGDNPFLGMLYDPEEPSALAQALVRAHATDWSQNEPAILEWASQFAWPSIGQQFMALYRQIL
ncbi:MAG: glycosyltransferase [Chloroflexota bacterium]|nr:glycosyltransferase [Chloroflexota bacterium]